MSVNRGMDKEDVVHIHSGILHNRKRNKIMPFAVIWINLEIVILSKFKLDTERQVYDITYIVES